MNLSETLSRICNVKEKCSAAKLDRYGFWQTTVLTLTSDTQAHVTAGTSLWCATCTTCDFMHTCMWVSRWVLRVGFHPVICACDLSNSIQFSLQSAQNGEAKQINFGSAQRFLDSADAVICILQAHTFCTLISIFYNFWGLCLSSTLSFEKVWMHIKRYYYFNKAINLYLNAEPKVITAGERDC